MQFFIFHNSECNFAVRTFPHDVFVAEDEPISLMCGHKNFYGGDNHIWTNCKWTRPNDGLSCEFKQKRNTTTNHFEIDEECPFNMTPRMRFAGSTRKTLLDGNNICAISVFGARLENTGSWGCTLDYTGWMDYGMGNEWCTARASAWLKVYFIG